MLGRANKLGPFCCQPAFIYTHCFSKLHNFTTRHLSLGFYELGSGVGACALSFLPRGSRLYSHQCLVVHLSLEGHHLGSWLVCPSLSLASQRLKGSVNLRLQGRIDRGTEPQGVECFAAFLTSWFLCFSSQGSV